MLQIFNSKEFGKIGVDFRQKCGVGQERAMTKLRHLLGEGRFVETRFERPPFALWAVLRPRDEAIFCPEPGVTPGQLQKCISVDTLAVGKTVRPDGTCCDGVRRGGVPMSAKPFIPHEQVGRSNPQA